MPDWSLLRSFLAVAETGSLSGAARSLGMTQPTLGRHIQMLEQDLGISLFRRQARGMVLTELGETLLGPARRMREAALAIDLAAAGDRAALDGTVRITASVFTAHHNLPPILARLRAETPELEIEVVATDESDNLLFREADIAIRMYRPEQLDMTTRHLGDFGLGFFAAESYLARKGRPALVEDLQHHDLVGLDRSELLIRGMRAYGWSVTRDTFPLRCDHHTVYFEMIAAGAGIGILQHHAARKCGELVQILPEVSLPGLPVWLTCPTRLRRTPRVARVWDALAEGLTPLLEPPGRLSGMPD